MGRLRKHLALYRQFLLARDGGVRKKAIRASWWVGIASVSSGILSFAKSIVLARLLTPDQFGLMAACMVIVRAIEVFTETGLGSALIQRRGGNVDDALPTVYTVSAVRGLVLSLVVIAVSPFVARFYEEPRLVELLQVLALALLFGGLTNLKLVVAQKDLDFKPLFQFRQAVMLVEILVTVCLAFWWRSVWALVVGYVVKALVAVPLSFHLLKSRPRFGWNRELAIELFTYGKYITGVSIVVYVTTEIDNVVIGRLLGMEALGAYVLAYTLANLPATHFSKVVSGVMFAAFSKIQDDQGALQRAYVQTVQLVSTFALPASVGLAVLAEEIVGAVYGPNWQLAAEALPILCLFSALRAISSIDGYVYNAVGKPRISFLINLTKLLLIALFIIPATREFGIRGAAIAVTAPSIVMFFAGWPILVRSVGIPIKLVVKALLPATGASLAMGIAVVTLKHWYDFDTIPWLLLVIAVGAAFYTVINWSRVRFAVRLLSER